MGKRTFSVGGLLVSSVMVAGFFVSSITARANSTTYTIGDVTELNSGAQPTATAAHYFVNISLDTSSPTTVHFVCLIHPGMQGAVTVVPANSEASPLTPAQVSAAAAAQYTADNTEAFAAE